MLPFGYISQLLPEGRQEARGFVARLRPEERAVAAWQRLRVCPWSGPEDHS